MRAAILLLAIAAAGCGLNGSPEPRQVDSDGRADSPAALAREIGWRPGIFVGPVSGAEVYASRVQDGMLEIIGFERSGGEWHRTLGGQWEGIGGTNTVAVSEGIRSGTFISGSAAAGVERVSTDAPNAIGGIVVDGAWSIWSPDESLLEADDTVAWQFLAEDGSIVERGTGWQWPFGSPFGSPPPMP